MLTFEQQLDAMQRDAGPMAALVFTPCSYSTAAFSVVPHKRRSDVERDEDHAGSARCGRPLDDTDA